MTTQVTRLLVLAATLGFSVHIANAQPTLTGISLFSSDSAGAYGGPDIWDSVPGGNFDTWVRNGSGTFLNGPTDSAASPNIALSTGTTSFGLFAAPGTDFAHFGINLFFNGATTPSISAYCTMLTTSTGAHVFAADSSSTPSGLGAGTLSFTSAGKLVTLTDFYWATPSAFNLDLVGQTSTGADGQLDYVGGLTFSVTSVPEPQYALWAVVLLAGAVTVYRRGCVSSSNSVS